MSRFQNFLSQVWILISVRVIESARTKNFSKKQNPLDIGDRSWFRPIPFQAIILNFWCSFQWCIIIKVIRDHWTCGGRFLPKSYNRDRDRTLILDLDQIWPQIWKFWPRKPLCSIRELLNPIIISVHFCPHKCRHLLQSLTEIEV